MCHCQTQPGPHVPVETGPSLPTEGTLPARCGYLELLTPRVPPASGEGHPGLQVQGGQGL